MHAPDFIRVSYADPHVLRARQILAAHPEVRELSGPTPSTALWVTALVVTQFAIGIALGRAPWFVWVPAAYFVGATIDHALWVLIHDCSHNLVFKRRTPNLLVALAANLPILLPGAMGFCKYHLLHHRHLGNPSFDADVPGEAESRAVGDVSIAKATWLALYPVVVGIIRPRRIKSVPFIDGWLAANFVVQIMATAAFVALFGWGPMKYLAVSTVLAIGLHPLGARWIQEHFVFHGEQETYSYYGPLNALAFNMGYHNEHHDLITIPWSRLPRLRALAPEFYEPLYAHYSWSRLLVTFIRDRRVTLFRRVVRTSS